MYTFVSFFILGTMKNLIILELHSLQSDYPKLSLIKKYSYFYAPVYSTFWNSLFLEDLGENVRKKKVEKLKKKKKMKY